MLSTVQTSKAQYTLVTKGDIIKYDSAVAVEISTYRNESAKLKIADSLINSLQYEIKLLQIEVDTYEKVQINHSKTVGMLNSIIKNKQILLEKNIKEYQDLLIKSSERKFYKRPEFWGVIGFVLGALII